MRRSNFDSKSPMISCLKIVVILSLSLLPWSLEAAPLTIPGSTAYSIPEAGALRMSRDRGVVGWKDPAQSVVWYGLFKTAGEVSAKVKVNLPAESHSRLKLTVGGKSQELTVTGAALPGSADFGQFTLTSPGYHRFILENLNPAGTPAGQITALELDGPALEGAHFNTDPRRNAASVHLSFPTPKDTPITAFYNEVTALEDPVHSFYMACGFSRGYFGMQVNSLTERRIIFSVWDAGNGSDARDRSTVAGELHTKLIAKGTDVEASVFGNEGTGGHSHLKYLWKSGEKQKFVVTVKPDGTTTDYSGYWFHPAEQQWKLIASFRAPKDGKHLRGLHSFSENFSGETGHMLRKARYGNQWIQTSDGKWAELTRATFSHDATGKADRLDRFMGVENGGFFLSHGGFVDGFTAYGTPFDRPGGQLAPDLKLPSLP